MAAAEAMGTIVSACVWLLGLLRAQAGRLGGLLPLPPIHLVWGRCAVQQAGHASVRHTAASEASCGITRMMVYRRYSTKPVHHTVPHPNGAVDTLRMTLPKGSHNTHS